MRKLQIWAQFKGKSACVGRPFRRKHRFCEIKQKAPPENTCGAFC
jgi:hypothetical protein